MVDELTNVADDELKTLLQSGKAQEAKQYIVALASLINTEATTVSINIGTQLFSYNCTLFYLLD